MLDLFCLILKMVCYRDITRKLPTELIRYVDGDINNVADGNRVWVPQIDLLLHPDWVINVGPFLNGAEIAYVDRIRRLLGNGHHRALPDTIHPDPLDDVLMFEMI